LREIKLLQHFRGHRNVRQLLFTREIGRADRDADHLSIRHGYSTTGQFQ
jgi:hypothetical protein